MILVYKPQRYMGIVGGANHIGVTVNGLGERGKCSFRRSYTLKFVYGYETNIDTTKFRETSKYVSTSGRALPP